MKVQLFNTTLCVPRLAGQISHFLMFQYTPISLKTQTKNHASSDTVLVVGCVSLTGTAMQLTELSTFYREDENEFHWPTRQGQWTANVFSHFRI